MKYDDIMNLSRPKSKHEKMSLLNRAAQFAPFAALNGYEDELVEVRREVSKRRILSTDMKQELNDKIREALRNNWNIKAVYFIPDTYKDGGKYLEKYGKIKRVDVANGLVIFNDGTKINLNDLYLIERAE